MPVSQRVAAGHEQGQRRILHAECPKFGSQGARNVSGMEGKWTSQYGLERTHGTVESRQHNNTITVTHWSQASACFCHLPTLPSPGNCSQGDGLTRVTTVTQLGIETSRR